MYRHLLVPLDLTDLAVQVVSNAVALAGSVRARITFLHVAREAQVPGEPGLPAPEAWLARELLAKAEAGARAAGVACQSRLVRGQSPDAAIAQVARELGCDLVFMASPARGGRRGAPADSQTLSVLIEGGLTVLVSATDEPRAPERAIAVIRDEHRSLAAVIHAASALLAVARERQEPADAAAMRSVVSYLRSFPAQHHHPKEEEHLFPRLRAHTHEYDAEIDELQRQHARDHVLIEQLPGLVDALEQGSRDERLRASTALQEAIARYAELHWEHMGREETVLMPAAMRYLDARDWEALNTAFAAPAGPVLDFASAPDHRRLLATIAAAGSTADDALAGGRRH
jgi:nucleotide-binding universal stress UspA family protein/hemerythrin-like domain-containing protein